jgi:hypothetical protein
MGTLETRFRRRPLITRQQIGTIYGEQHPLHAHFKGEPYEKTLWGVADGNPEVTHLLYVFSAPGRLAGTALLMHDVADPAKPDSMWVYLRSFDSFTRLAGGSERTMVPGTALTYEDARGFVPRDKYRFTFTRHADITVGAGEKLVLGCPVTASVREALGYDSIVVLVDGGEEAGPQDPLPRPRREEPENLRGRPHDEARRRAAAGVHSHGAFRRGLRHHHRLRVLAIEGASPAAIYDAAVTKEKFLPRLQRLLDEAGIGDTLRAEITVAEKRIEEYEQRIREQADPQPSPQAQP